MTIPLLYGNNGSLDPGTHGLLLLLLWNYDWNPSIPNGKHNFNILNDGIGCLMLFVVWELVFFLLNFWGVLISCRFWGECRHVLFDRLVHLALCAQRTLHREAIPGVPDSFGEFVKLPMQFMKAGQNISPTLISLK